MGGGCNPDETPKSAEIHLGDAFVNDKVKPVPSTYELPSQIRVHLSKAKAAYLVFGKAGISTSEKKIKVDFDKDFKFD